MFKIFRIFKAFRYSKNIEIVSRVFKRQKGSLVIVCTLVAGYILLTALIMFNVEPKTFDNSFEAVYWATIGYGDIYAV